MCKLTHKRAKDRASDTDVAAQAPALIPRADRAADLLREVCKGRVREEGHVAKQLVANLSGHSPQTVRLLFKSHMYICLCDLRLQDLGPRGRRPNGTESRPGNIGFRVHIAWARALLAWQGLTSLRLLGSEVHRTFSFDARRMSCVALLPVAHPFRTITRKPKGRQVPVPGV